MERYSFRPETLTAVVTVCVLSLSCGGVTPPAGNPDAGTGTQRDAGLAESCTSSATCNSPPDQCYTSPGNCSGNRCIYLPKEDGTPCRDGSPPGQCFDGTGICSQGICVHSSKAKGTSCDDGNLCTTKDACDDASVCKGEPLCAPPSQCFEATVDCANGSCQYQPKSKGASCDDGDACTLNDACNGVGICEGRPMSCNSPDNQCRESAGTCSNGLCSYPNKPSGSDCNDANVCITGDYCDGQGTCMSGDVARTCTDDDANCLMATGCHPSQGCTYESRCQNNQACYQGRCCTIPQLSGQANFTPVYDCPIE
jgi:hypothetical protein